MEGNGISVKQAVAIGVTAALIACAVVLILDRLQVQRLFREVDDVLRSASTRPGSGSERAASDDGGGGIGGDNGGSGLGSDTFGASGNSGANPGPDGGGDRNVEGGSPPAESE